MGNIKNYNYSRVDLRLSNNDYWDFYLAADDGGKTLSCAGVTSGDCFVTFYDFNNSNIYDNTQPFSATSIHSLVSWNGAINTGYTGTTIGLTGIDNGLYTFNKTTGDTSNLALLSVLTGTTMLISSGDTRLMLNRVTGTTGEYIYPIDIMTGFTGAYAQLCGGFYQGFYKLDGNSYEVLPTRVQQAWSAEFWLNPSSAGCVGYTATTLNDTYPNNKGIFFYMGTRAENKFWNTFDGVDSGCTIDCTVPSGCTDNLSPWCTLPKETDVILAGAYGVGIPLNPPLINIDLITNPFLIYGRAVSGSSCGGSSTNTSNETANSWDGKPKVIVTHSQEVTNTTNPFLIYGRAVSGSSCGGSSTNTSNKTVRNFTGFTKDQDTLDYNLDIIDNALAFRIKDDGSIGYRLLTVTGHCYTAVTGERKYISGTTIEEQYSSTNIISKDEWQYVVVRFVTEYYDNCELKNSERRKGKLMFYVNAKLKAVFYDVDELVARRLNDNHMKQVGVPFNLSLGGGSQGLLESQTFDGLDMDDRGLPIEENFAGTFIGGISQFKFNICDLNFCDIENNFNSDSLRYGINISNYNHC